MNTEHDPVVSEILAVVGFSRGQSTRYIDYSAERNSGKTFAEIALKYPQAESFEAEYQRGCK